MRDDMNDLERDLRTGGDAGRPGGDAEQLRGVLISADDHLRDIVLDSIRNAELPIAIGLDIIPPPRPLDSEHLERLRSYDPHVVILDMAGDPDRDVRMANAIASGVPRTTLVGMGPELDATSLLEAMRAGVVEYVPGPVDQESVQDALERVIRKSGWGNSLEGRRNGKVLAFFSPKGGSGSTTVVTNVGIELHRLTGKKTLLVDLDLELGEIASLLGVRPRFNFVDLVRNIHRMDADLLSSYIEGHKSGVQVLSAPFEPEIGEQVGGEEITRALGLLRSHYDYVLVDVSKSLSAPARAALLTADQIYLITNMDVPSLRNLKRCLPILDGVTAGDEERLRLVVNRFSGKRLVGLEDIEETLGLDVYWTLPNDFETVITSISAGQPLVLQGNSRYAKELTALARDIAGTPKGRSAASLIGRLVSRFRRAPNRSETTRRYEPAEVSAHG
jgi:pilus assembly protein CpaE